MEGKKIAEEKKIPWKCITGQIIIGILGIIALWKGGDGTVLTAVITAEATLAGVTISKVT